MNTLIVYASKHGTVEKCVEILKEKVDNKVDVMNFGYEFNKDDFNLFEKFILKLINNKEEQGIKENKISKFVEKMGFNDRGE